MKVAIYVRVSTEEQAQEGYSIDGQIKLLSDYCQKNDYKIYEIYKDEGFSGKSTDRLGLQKLLLDCTKNKFQKVLVWKISRLARKQLDFLNIIETFKENNVNFFSLSEAIDDSTPTGTAMLQMMGTFAELERNQIVENLTMGMQQRAREGKWNGGVILGYKSVSKQLVIEPNEAHIVKKIFEQYLSGKGYKAIAHQLNREGYKTKRNKAFSINSIRQILLNPVYAGFIRFGKTNTNETNIIKGIHEPIIPLDLWEKAQELHKQKSHKPAKTFVGHFPLTTLLRCPTCNQGMIGHHSKKSKNSDEYIRYYQCGDFHYKGSAICKSNLVRADDAEKYIFEKLKNLLSNTDYLASIVHSLNHKLHLVKQPLHEQLEYINKQIASLEKNIEKYLSLFENDLLDGSIVKQKILEYETELKELKNTRSEVDFEINKPTVNEITFDRVYHSLKHFQNVLMYTEPLTLHKNF